MDVQPRKNGDIDAFFPTFCPWTSMTMRMMRIMTPTFEKGTDPGTEAESHCTLDLPDSYLRKGKGQACGEP